MGQKKILFVCLGNICRSPMAEFVMKKLVSDAKKSEGFEIASAATCTDELGNPVYSPAKAKLREKGIPFSERFARQMTRADYDYYDCIVAMDRGNVRQIRALVGGDPQNKVSLLMSYAGECRDVADPWYTGDFEATYRDVLAGCIGILKSL